MSDSNADQVSSNKQTVKSPVIDFYEGIILVLGCKINELCKLKDEDFVKEWNERYYKVYIYYLFVIIVVISNDRSKRSFIYI